MSPRRDPERRAFLFPTHILEGRFIDLWKWAESYVEAFNRRFGTTVEINLRKLYMAVISAYDDIARFKNYHFEDPEKKKSDGIKRAAYLTKWICRFKPLYQSGDSDVPNIENLGRDPSVLANEFFASFVTALNLSVECGKNFIFTERKEYEFVYDLLYREITSDGLVLFNQLVVDSIKGTQVYRIL